MLLAEAQSLWPISAASTVRFEPHDPSADRQQLRELARLCLQFSPTVGIDAVESPDCLLVDATGCGWGPGGEVEFAAGVVACADSRGYRALVAVADTVGAAWAATHFRMSKYSLAGSAESRVLIVGAGKQEDMVRPLPLEALRVEAAVVAGLRDLNVSRVDQLLTLPRDGLATRFGADLLLSIDRALGVIPEGLTAERPDDPVEASWQFEPPVGDRDVLTAVIGHLLERLLTKIHPDGLGIQRLLCSLKSDEHDPIHFPVELLRPSTSRRALMELVGLRLERLRPPSEVESVTVRAVVVGPVGNRQGDLFGPGQGSGRIEIAGLIERLSSRLGERAVLRPRAYPDAQPELAFVYDPWIAAVNQTPARKEDREAVPLTRPIVLKNRPIPVEVISVFTGGAPVRFHWDGRGHLVERTWGPERIETGWWRGADVRRDYYTVESTTGHLFWLFRDLMGGGWFLHGLYG